MNKAITGFVVAVLLLCFVAVCADTAARTSATWDEGGHIAAGYSYWRTGAYKVITSNLFLSQKIIALPLLWSRHATEAMPEVPSSPDPTLLGAQLLFGGSNSHEEILRLARGMVTAVALLLAMVVFRQSATLFGRPSALLSLALMVSCPVIISNASLATTDLIAATALFLSVGAFWRLLNDVRGLNIALVGLTLGALVLTKYSFVAFGIVGAILAAIRLCTVGSDMRFRVTAQIAWATAAAVGISWVLIWAFFGFRANPGQVAFDWSLLGPGTLSFRFAAALRPLHLLPDPYLFDLAGGMKAMRSAHPSFVGGTYSDSAQLKFFPLLFALKTPLAMIVAVAIAAPTILRQRGALDGDGRAVGYDCLPHLTLVAVYSGLAVVSTVNLGIRHLLPIYPPLFVLAGGALMQASRLRVVTGAFIAMSSIACSASTHPNELGYYNFLGGGPRRGYAWFVDSSTDWGERLPDLQHWLEQGAGGGAKPQSNYLIYFGTAVPEAYSIHATQLSGFFYTLPSTPIEPAAGRYIVSPTWLQGGDRAVFGPWTVTFERDYQSMRARARLLGGENHLPFGERARLLNLTASRLCATLRKRSPDQRVGTGFFVYNLDSETVNKALNGPPVELYPGLPVTLPLQP